jgi:hypothetical protein
LSGRLGHDPGDQRSFHTQADPACRFGDNLPQLVLAQRLDWHAGAGQQRRQPPQFDAVRIEVGTHPDHDPRHRVRFASVFRERGNEQYPFLPVRAERKQLLELVDDQQDIPLWRYALQCGAQGFHGARTRGDQDREETRSRQRMNAVLVVGALRVVAAECRDQTGPQH